MSENRARFFDYVPVILATVQYRPGEPAVAAGSDDPWYDQLVKAPETPPDITFAIVWPILFVLMGIAACLVVGAAGGLRESSKAIGLYFTQLALNLAWSWLFFFFERPQWSMLDLGALWLLIVLTIAAFWRWSRLAAVLMVPYLLWVSFAGYLNGYIVLNN